MSMNTPWMTRWSYSREKWRWIVTHENRPVALVCLICLDEQDKPDKTAHEADGPLEEHLTDWFVFHN